MNNTGKENCTLQQVSPIKVRDYFRVNAEENLVLSKALDLEVIYTDVRFEIQTYFSQFGPHRSTVHQPFLVSFLELIMIRKITQLLIG